jgi:hypothetical protein
LPEPRRGAVVPACLFAWLLPGAGHFYLRRRSKGLIFLLCIGGLFVLGVAMKAGLKMHVGFDDPLAFLRSLSQMAIGLPYMVARALGFGAGLTKDVTAVTHEYGNTFTEVGGLLNVLVILDAHDTALGRKP